MAEFSPTLEEFVYSFVPGRMFDPTLENLLYWDIKLAVSLAPMAVRTAWLMKSGMTFWEATYIAGDNYTVYKWFKTPTRIRATASSVSRGVPIIAAPVAAIAATTAIMRDPHFQKTGTPKPSWLPLPIWVAIAGR